MELVRRFNIEIPHNERVPYDKSTFDEYIDWIAQATNTAEGREERMSVVLDKLRT